MVQKQTRSSNRYGPTVHEIPETQLTRCGMSSLRSPMSGGSPAGPACFFRYLSVYGDAFTNGFPRSRVLTNPVINLHFCYTRLMWVVKRRQVQQSRCKCFGHGLFGDCGPPGYQTAASDRLFHRTVEALSRGVTSTRKTWASSEAFPMGTTFTGIK